MLMYLGELSPVIPKVLISTLTHFFSFAVDFDCDCQSINETTYTSSYTYWSYQPWSSPNVHYPKNCRPGMPIFWCNSPGQRQSVRLPCLHGINLCWAGIWVISSLIWKFLTWQWEAAPHCRVENTGQRDDKGPIIATLKTTLGTKYLGAVLCSVHTNVVNSKFVIYFNGTHYSCLWVQVADGLKCFWYTDLGTWHSEFLWDLRVLPDLNFTGFKDFA